MKKYLLLVPLFLLSFGFVNAEIIYHVDESETKTPDFFGAGINDSQVIKGTVITSATTTINQIYIWLEADVEDEYLAGELKIVIDCKKANATTTTCDSGEGWYTGPEAVHFYPLGNIGYNGTTTITTTKSSYRFEPASDRAGTQETTTISPGGIYIFSISADPTGTDDLYSYGTTQDIANSCWVEYYITAQTQANCAGLNSTNLSAGALNKELSILLAYVSTTDTDTRIVNFSPSSTLIESENTSEIVTFTTQWYYNPTEWVGTAGYQQVAVYPTNFDTGFTYAPKFMDINASGLDTDYTTFELYTGYHHISVCFFTDWEATGDYLANLCSEYSLVVGTTTQDIPYLEVYDPLYGGQIPTGETDCSLEGSVTEKAICYLTNSLAKLFIPNEAPWTTMFNGLRTELAYKFPFGYYTRTVDIITDTATTTSPFPVLSVTTKADSPVGAGDYGFDLGSIFTTANGYIRNDFTSDEGILESGESVNIWDIIMPFINWGVYISLFIIILGDIVGIGFGYQSSVKDVSRRIIVKQK